MMDNLNLWFWASDHPFLFTFLVWSCLWLGWGIAIIVSSISTMVTYPFRVWKRKIRSKDLQTLGWQQAPIDADGDVVYPPKAGSKDQ